MSVRQAVRLLEHGQTDTRTDGSDSMTSTADAGGNEAYLFHVYDGGLFMLHIVLLYHENVPVLIHLTLPTIDSNHALEIWPCNLDLVTFYLDLMTMTSLIEYIKHKGIKKTENRLTDTITHIISH